MSASATLNLGHLGGGSVLNVQTHNSQKPLLLLHGTQPLPLLASSPNHLPRLSYANFSWKTSANVKTAVDSSGPSEKQETQNKTYHFVVANAKFMLDEEEHFQEQLSERLRLFGERNQEQDFWLVIEPKFLDKFPNITKRLKRPAVALVSTNGPWITFMKLRLDRVLQGSFEAANSVEEALESNPVNLEFDKPEKWTAPYPKYEYGWWEPFLPPGSKTAKV